MEVDGLTLYDGRTALHYACIGGHIDVVHYLLSAGAKPKAVDMVRSDGGLWARRDGLLLLLLPLSSR